MPIYEYKCDEGHVFEAIQSFSEDPLAACTKCSAPAQRLLSAPAIHFKGSGFYTTDYGSKSKTAASDGGGDSTGSSTDSSSSSGDSASSNGSGESSKGSSGSSSGDTAKTPA